MSHQETASGDGDLGWFGIVRFGLIQASLGAIIVLMTSTLNRVMVVELALPAMLPGALVTIHYAIQMLRPRLGYGSDVGGRRTPWIIGGMATLAAGGVAAAASTALMATTLWLGILAAVISFFVIGVGVGAAGTSLLVLLSSRVSARRRPVAAMVVWLMMIAGFAVTATSAGSFLDPFSHARLVAVTAAVAGAAFLLSSLAVIGLEGARKTLPKKKDKPPFRTALRQVWDEQLARRFAIFVFVSMLAYSGQDLILEPFAGTVFGFTPGESTRLSGTHHGGVFAGMVCVGVLGTLLGGITVKSMRTWVMGGCLASAICLFGLSFGGAYPQWPVEANVFALGASNGAFAVAAIGAMMGLASVGRKQRDGVRMGVWGAAQAIAFGLGGFLATVAVDVSRTFIGDASAAYALVFAIEGFLFVAAAMIALRVHPPVDAENRLSAKDVGEGVMSGVAP